MKKILFKQYSEKGYFPFYSRHFGGYVMTQKGFPLSRIIISKERLEMVEENIQFLEAKNLQTALN